MVQNCHFREQNDRFHFENCKMLLSFPRPGFQVSHESLMLSAINSATRLTNRRSRGEKR